MSLLDKFRSLPPVKAPNFDERIREMLSIFMGTRGDRLDRVVTVRDLVGAKVAGVGASYLSSGQGNPLSGPAAGLIYEPDLTPPPTPSGFTATTSKTSIQVVTAPQTYLQGHGHAKTIVYGVKYTGGALPTFADAVKLDEFSGDVHAFPVDPAADYRLWVKWVTQDGAVSDPAGGINGIEATAGLLDSANIAELTASKIRAGAISVGEYIQSAGYVAGSAGWRISGNGVAEFSGVIVRGQVIATTGSIGGNTIDATGMQSPNYVPGSIGWRLDSSGIFRSFAFSGTRLLDMAATGTSPVLKIGAGLSILADGSLTLGSNFAIDSAGTISMKGSIRGGAYTGYAWPAPGQSGFYLGPEGLLLGNGASGGKYFQVTADGNIYTPAFYVVNGVMSVTQANVINTLNIAGNAVSSTASVTGTAATVSTSLFVPAGQTMRIVAIASLDGEGGPLADGPGGNLGVTINGTSVAGGSVSSYPVYGAGDTSPTTHATPPLTLAGQMDVFSGGGASIVISATGTFSRGKTLIAFGTLR